MDYWSKPTIDREQMPLFVPTLGDAVAQDHPVRMFDEILGGVDWSGWGAGHPQKRGRAPVHPRVVAARDAQLEEALSQMAANDRQEDGLFGQEESDNRLPPDLATLDQRRKALSDALSTAKEADQARRQADGKKAKPVQVPLTDQDAKVQPNKEGGFAPNYTPMATTDGARGFIVDQEVIAGGAAAATGSPLLDRLKSEFGGLPARMFLDGAYGVGQNLEAFESRQIEAFTPMTSTELGDSSAQRPAASRGGAGQPWEELPE